MTSLRGATTCLSRRSTDDTLPVAPPLTFEQLIGRATLAVTAKGRDKYLSQARELRNTAMSTVSSGQHTVLPSQCKLQSGCSLPQTTCEAHCDNDAELLECLWANTLVSRAEGDRIQWSKDTSRQLFAVLPYKDPKKRTYTKREEASIARLSATDYMYALQKLRSELVLEWRSREVKSEPSKRHSSSEEAWGL